jgi:hypothetical protein
MTMVLLILLAVGLAGACAWAVWPCFHDIADDPRVAGSPIPVECGVRDSLEGALVAQLGAGEITRPQYLRAMERLAARDDERNPLVVPPF